jgi:hypothetical protein
MVVRDKVEPFLAGFPAVVSGSVFPPPVIYHDGSQTRTAEIPVIVAGNPVTRAETCFALNVAAALGSPISPPLPRTIERGIGQDLLDWFPEIVATALVEATVTFTSSFQLRESETEFVPSGTGMPWESETSFWRGIVRFQGEQVAVATFPGDDPPTQAALEAATGFSFGNPFVEWQIFHHREQFMRKSRIITEEYDSVIIVPQLEFNEALYRAAFGLAGDIPMLFIGFSEYPINTPVVLGPAGQVTITQVRERFLFTNGPSYDEDDYPGPPSAETAAELDFTWPDDEFANSTFVSEEDDGDLSSGSPVGVDMGMVCRACVAVDQASFNFMQGTAYGIITELGVPFE